MKTSKAGNIPKKDESNPWVIGKIYLFIEL